MDRQVPIGNRLVHQKIQEYRIRKHRQTLSLIKNSRGSLHNKTSYNQQLIKFRLSSENKVEKNLQIQRQNIKIFNKIADIIRERPKYTEIVASSQSLKEAQLKLKKQQQKIKTQNEVLQKRLHQQKPTIKNKELERSRIKNLRYLKIMGKYPYQKTNRTSCFLSKSTSQITSQITSMRNQTQALIHNQIILHRQKLQDYIVQISRLSNNTYLFTIEQQGKSKKQYKMTMKKDIYQNQFIKCKYNYQQMISRLRLNNYHQVTFDYIHGP